MTDMTIREVRTTLLQLPWADDPWLAGHALGPMRDLVVVEVETAGGLTGMGYLHLLNRRCSAPSAPASQEAIRRASSARTRRRWKRSGATCGARPSPAGAAAWR